MGLQLSPVVSAPSVSINSVDPLAVASVNLATTGQTILYTVPATSKLMITDIILVVNTAVSIVGTATCSVGSSTPFTQWCALSLLTGFNSVGGQISLGQFATAVVRQIFSSSTVINFNVGTAISVGTLTATAYLFGNLF